MPNHSTSSSSTALEQLSFEDALSELEQIVRALENGQMKLEEAITAYERGAALRRHCELRLGEAEMRVKAIVQHADGSIHQDDISSAAAPNSREEPSR
ncbi:MULTISPECIES: exodeoxyribonuclease VII small subunit [Saccharibacter]|uniref:Exodeoxyribonuclease 7 small subunit n=1 Tax=Saccharibacter floricola DSM 15669 TaxID=1123227 RepID=A0ABQ0NXA3_9PROT|nr:MULTISPECIES: exodeoxyribonuclease VII small subunit [Saccharibacter]MXV34967.1 exodeoxyribonuclease VII small subunit [Saccharibacter sp. EH611]MXV57487.1 exodeoxyribonuclease VII small subunit [Saccharibacter sp. EH70]MXV64652.1 exodeoxyribonuclease VII small subunit [Saccharibacter sp. EH60]GBQ05494.1 exodeoxyribonuclease VII small subunit [Saccharibacter floricola DSM 15669]